MKTMFAIAVLAIIGGIATNAANAQETPDTWKRSDVNLRTLIDYDFTVIDTNFIELNDSKATVEVIYLRKGDRVFRCFTHEPQGQAAKHWCDDLQ